MLRLKRMLLVIISCQLAKSLLPTNLVSAQKDKVLNVTVGSETPSINPALGVDTVSGVAIRNVFEWLTRLDAEGAPQPAAAESWEAGQDGLIYTFTLREYSLGSDGTPVTADYPADNIQPQVHYNYEDVVLNNDKNNVMEVSEFSNLKN